MKTSILTEKPNIMKKRARKKKRLYEHLLGFDYKFLTCACVCAKFTGLIPPPTDVLFE